MAEINIKLELETFATLIAGIYCTYTGVNPIAIPQDLWMKLAKDLSEELDDWNYEVNTFEKWLQQNLLIIPKDLCSDGELEEFQENSVYYEWSNGNIWLVVTYEL